METHGDLGKNTNSVPPTPHNKCGSPVRLAWGQQTWSLTTPIGSDQFTLYAAHAGNVHPQPIGGLQYRLGSGPVSSLAAARYACSDHSLQYLDEGLGGWRWTVFFSPHEANISAKPRALKLERHDAIARERVEGCAGEDRDA